MQSFLSVLMTLLLLSCGACKRPGVQGGVGGGSSIFAINDPVTHSALTADQKSMLTTLWVSVDRVQDPSATNCSNNTASSITKELALAITDITNNDPKATIKVPTGCSYKFTVSLGQIKNQSAGTPTNVIYLSGSATKLAAGQAIDSNITMHPVDMADGSTNPFKSIVLGAESSSTSTNVNINVQIPTGNVGGATGNVGSSGGNVGTSTGNAGTPAGNTGTPTGNTGISP